MCKEAVGEDGVAVIKSREDIPGGLDAASAVAMVTPSAVSLSMAMRGCELAEERLAAFARSGTFHVDYIAR
jgi:hypothetical protein